MKQKCRACHRDFDASMPTPLCLSCDSDAAMFSRNEMYIKILELESQLAQLAAERDVLGKVEAMLRADYDLEVSCGATVITADEWHIYVAAHDIGGDQGKSSVVRPTLLAALAALVAAAGREESK